MAYRSRYDRDFDRDDERSERNRDFTGRDFESNQPRYGQRGREDDSGRYRSSSGFGNEFGSGFSRDYNEGRGERWRQGSEDWGRGQQSGRESGKESWDRPFESGRTSNFGEYDRNRQYNFGDYDRDRESGSQWDRERGFSGQGSYDYDQGRTRFQQRPFSGSSGRSYSNESPSYNQSSYGQGYQESNWRSGRNYGLGWGPRSQQGERDFGQSYGSVFRNDYEDYGSFDRNRGGREESIGESIKSFFGIGPKGYKRSDDRIKDDISERLEDHPRIDASEIEISVHDGEVTLTGVVDNRDAKRLAEDVTERVRGVKDVHNQIRVQIRSLMGTTGVTGSPTSGKPATGTTKDKDKERAA